MKKSSLVAAAIAAGLVSSIAVAGPGGTATAAELAELSVVPTEPSVAEVCWTEFTPDAGTVTGYRLRIPERSSLPSSVDANSCTELGELKTSTAYTFILEAQIDGGAYVSAAEDVVAKAYSLSAQLSKSSAKAGQKVTVSGTLKAGKPIGNGEVIIEQRLKPSDQWEQMGAPVATKDDGTYSKSFKAKSTTNIRVYFKGLDGGPATVGAWNSNHPLEVTPVFSLTFSKNPVKLGKAVTARGTVKAGNVDALAGDNVCLQKKQKGTWGNGACVKIADDGSFSHKFTPRSKADLFYRWRASSIAPEYVSGNSPKQRLVVR